MSGHAPGAGRVRVAATPWARLRGLLFRDPSWLGEGGVLVLAPCSSVHTFGMRHALDIAFVGPDGAVVSARRGVPPGRLLRAPGAAIALERFADPGLPWPEMGAHLESRRVFPYTFTVAASSRPERGAAAAMEGYCMKCKEKQEIVDPKEITTKNGRPMTKGTCAVCGTTICKIGKVK